MHKIQLTNDQYQVAKKIAELQDVLQYLQSKDFGYYKVNDLVKAYRSGNVEIVE